MDSRHLWQVLAGLPSWQMTEIPRRDDSSTGDAGLAQRVQALASAYGRGAPLALAWVRDRPGGLVQVLAAGPAMSGGSDAGQAVLTLPAGARAMPLEDGGVAAILGAVPYWIRISGTADVLFGDDSGQAKDGLSVAPSLDDGMLSVWLDGFAWLLLAEPASHEVITELATVAARAQLAAQQLSNPRAKLAARRAGARHEELRRAAATGLWNLHLLAGAATAHDAACVAQMLCASADLRGLPYALSVQSSARPLADALAADGERLNSQEPDRAPVLLHNRDRASWDGPAAAYSRSADGARTQWQHTNSTAQTPAIQYPGDDQDEPVPVSPFFASSRLVSALARVPAREVPGVRFTLRPRFDVTPETEPSAHGITAGVVLDWNRMPAGPLPIPLTSLNRHVFVCGATGAGKSQTVRNLLEQASAAGIPWLVVEPAKAEYQLMAARLPDAEIIRIRPGDLDQPPAGLNPLEPATGPGDTRFPLQTHADLLRALFLAAFQTSDAV